MKASTKILALMVAMTAGMAGAQPAPTSPVGTTPTTAATAAGTGIVNVANASYNDPTKPPNADGTPNGSSTSNPVTTVVMPKPSFDINYNSGNDGTGGANPEANTPDAAKTVSVGQAGPGKSVDYTYKLTNTGNVPLTVDLTSLVPTATASATTVGAPKSVTYTYTDSKGTHTRVAGGSVVLPVGETGIQITQTITLPDNAPANYLYGATPVGTVQGGPTTVATTPDTNGIYTITGNGVAVDSILNENQIVDSSGTPIVDAAKQSFGANTDLQYVIVKSTPSSLDNTPPVTPPSNGTPPALPPNTPPTSVTPPTYTGGNTPPVTPPDSGTVPGPTPILMLPDQQIAYPPADTDKTADTVVFTNTITNSTPKTVNPTDTISLTPGGDNPNDSTKPGSVVSTDPINNLPNKVIDGNGVTWTKTDKGSWTGDNGVKVQFFDPASGGLADSLTVAGDSTGNYITQVTYPDSNPNAGTTTPDTPQPINVLIKATSGNNNTVSNTTTDTIMPAAATFGDTAAVTQAKDVAEDPSKAYYPAAAAGGTNTTTANTIAPSTSTTPSLAYYPMSISNSGQYDDTYTLAGAVAIPVPTSVDPKGYVIVPVNYTGATLTSPAADIKTTPTTGYREVTVQLPGGGTTKVYAPIYTTPTITAHSTSTGITATVTVPADALATSSTATTTGIGTDYLPTLQQTAIGEHSTISMTDDNDPLKIGAVGEVVVAKFTENAGTLEKTQYVWGNPAKTTTQVPSDTSKGIVNDAGYDAINNTQYQPGTRYSYKIIGKNTYNSSISNFSLIDDLSGKPFNTVTTSDIVCSDNGVASITSNIAKCTYSSPIASGAQVSMTITVSIK